MSDNLISSKQSSRVQIFRAPNQGRVSPINKQTHICFQSVLKSINSQDKSRQISSKNDIEYDDNQLQEKLNLYELLRIEFQKKHILIAQFDIVTTENPELCKIGLLKQMMNISQQLMMNELEISAWQMINKDIELVNLPNDQILQRLMMTALKAKKFVQEESEMKVFTIFLTHNYPKLMQSFNEWEEDTQIYDSGLDIKEEHIRRAVHTTKQTDQNSDANDDKHEIFNKKWIRSTDLKRELKEKIQKQKQQQQQQQSQSMTTNNSKIDRSRSRSPMNDNLTLCPQKQIIFKKEDLQYQNHNSKNNNNNGSTSTHQNLKSVKRELNSGNSNKREECQKSSRQDQQHQQTQKQNQQSQSNQQQQHNLQNAYKIFNNTTEISNNTTNTTNISQNTNNTQINAPQTFNQIYINNSQFLINPFINARKTEDLMTNSGSVNEKTPSSNSKFDVLPMFNPNNKSNESLMTLKQASFTLYDLFQKKNQESQQQQLNNQQSQANMLRQNNLSNMSNGLMGLDQSIRSLFPQSQMSGFGQSVQGFLQKGGQNSQLTPQMSFQHPFGVNMGGAGSAFALPDMILQGSFPTFFMQKSGSIDKSRNGSFIQFSRQNQTNNNNNNAGQNNFGLMNLASQTSLSQMGSNLGQSNNTIQNISSLQFDKNTKDQQQIKKQE
ncbi:UNKNOWN [Stylonychia lemnae]|uniref:Uncharacterized protein n=1 Tax=Stylonychia lemnae TaxID=5949 RepID=A0A077ZWC6_STYLE|nr:UNKNOWN [Stylonychia lemnae]|eukprot:CDW74245.1 UNKNOWN [Stylonychia lemnae]